MTATPNLEDEVLRLRRDVSDLVERCAALEAEVGVLSNLYVASRRLHETLDRVSVLRAIEEILINLVGSGELAIFELDARGATLSLSWSFGIERKRHLVRAIDDGPIGRAVRSGKTVIVDDEAPGSDLPRVTACVPLKLRDRVIGVIVLFQLLPQKPRLEQLDRELFDLLATAAASALHAAALSGEP